MPDDSLPRPDKVELSARNLADLLAATAARLADRTALTHAGRTVTWAELDQAASAISLALLERGLPPGGRVVLVLPTSVEFVQAYLGVLRAGGVAVPLNTGFTVAELARMIGRSGAFAVVASEPALAPVRQAVAGVADALTDAPGDLANRRAPRLVVLGATLPGETAFADLLAALQSGPPTAPGPPTGGEDPAVMLFTSGASSDPRAAVLSHRALVANLDQVMALDPPPVTEHDVLLGALPLFHVYGLNAVLGQAVRTGAGVVLTDRFDPRETLDLVRQHHVTVVPVAPPMLVAWSHVEDIDRYLGSVRYLVSGAAALPVHVLEAVESRGGVPIHQGYGLTEGAPVVTTTLASPTAKPGSVGRPVPGVQVLLGDESGHPVDEGDPGEIYIRGGNLFSGYFPGQVDGPATDGWWRTGDVAYADADGDLFLVDRIKDLVIVNGFNVYPREVEEALLEHPHVAEAAVVSVPHTVTGEAVKAVVVPVEGQTLTAQEVVAHCRERLARFKCPTDIEIVEQLPRTPTGKIAKGRLREAERRDADTRLAGLA
jgi:long-chain acyl-CoA synthetase